MEVTEQELRERYTSLETDELVDLSRRGQLTEAASSVLKEILDARGVGSEQFRALVAEEDAKDAEVTCEPVSTPLPRLWVGYAIAAAYLPVVMIAIFSLGENRALFIIAPALFVGLGYWLFCVHRIHWILAEATNNKYPTSPGKGAGFNLIPFFNLYWFFKWPNDVANFLNQQSRAKVMAKGWAGLFILVGWLLQVVDPIGLLVLFSVLVYVVRKVRQVIEFVPRSIEKDA